MGASGQSRQSKRGGNAKSKAKAGPEIIGRLIGMLWPGDRKYYNCRVLDFNQDTKQHKLLYFLDESVEDVDLSTRRWKFMPEPEVESADSGPYSLVGKHIVLESESEEGPSSAQTDFRACVIQVIQSEDEEMSDPPAEVPEDSDASNSAPIMHKVVFLANDYIAVVNLSGVKYVIVDSVTGATLRVVNEGLGKANIETMQDVEQDVEPESGLAIGEATAIIAPEDSTKADPAEKEGATPAADSSKPAVSGEETKGQDETREKIEAPMKAADLSETGSEKPKAVPEAAKPISSEETKGIESSAPVKSLPASSSSKNSSANAMPSAPETAPVGKPDAANSSPSPEISVAQEASAGLETGAPVVAEANDFAAKQTPREESSVPVSTSLDTPVIEAPLKLSSPVAIAPSTSAEEAAAAAAAAAAAVTVDLPDASFDSLPDASPLESPIKPDAETDATTNISTPRSIHTDQGNAVALESTNKVLQGDVAGTVPSSNQGDAPIIDVFTLEADKPPLKAVDEGEAEGGSDIDMKDMADPDSGEKQWMENDLVDKQGPAFAAAAIIPGGSASEAGPLMDEETKTVSDEDEESWAINPPKSTLSNPKGLVNKYIALNDPSKQTTRKAYVEAYLEHANTHFIAYCDSAGGSLQIRLDQNNHRVLSEHEVEVLSKRLSLNDTKRTPSSRRRTIVDGGSISEGDEIPPPGAFKRLRRMSSTKAKTEPPGAELVGCCITIRWPGNGGNYVALVVGYAETGPATRLHKVYYVQDESTEVLDLTKREWVKEGPGTEPWDRNGLVGKRLYVYWAGVYGDENSDDQRRAEEKFGKGNTKIPFEAFVVRFIDSFRYRLLYTQGDNLEDRDLTQEDQAWDVLEAGVDTVDGLTVISWSGNPTDE